MRRGLALGLGLLVSTAASAQAVGPVVTATSTVSWSPSTDADGDLTGYIVELAPTTPIPTPPPVRRLVGLTATPGSPKITIGSLALTGTGQWYVRVRAVDAQGNESGATGEVPFVSRGVAPAVPSGLPVVTP